MAQWHYSQLRSQALFVSRQLKVKKKRFLQQIKLVLPQDMPEPLLHPNSVENWLQATINSSYYAATEM